MVAITSGEGTLRGNPPRRVKEADLRFAFARATDRLEIALTYNTEVSRAW